MGRKRYVLCAIGAAFLLAACGGGTEPIPPEDDPPPAEDNGEPAPLPPAEPTPTVDINCTETNPHPIGMQIAATYNVTYEEVMTWFCSGEIFDDILLALQTHEATGVPVQELLDLNAIYGWEQVWADLGVFQPEQ
jgi:hypothetical protein